MRSGEEPAYGTGYLDSLDAGDHDYEWLRHVVLPLWYAPDEKSFHGRMDGGRVYPEGAALPYALTGAGLVEIEYERSGFIASEALAAGWLRIKLKPRKGWRGLDASVPSWNR